MSRLIDADEFKLENKRLLHCDFPYLSEVTLEELIDDAQTVDAVPVVRCKDCKYWGIPLDRNDKGEKVANCKMFSKHHAFNENWFCADGEKVTE